MTKKLYLPIFTSIDNKQDVSSIQRKILEGWRFVIEQDLTPGSVLEFKQGIGLLTAGLIFSFYGDKHMEIPEDECDRSLIANMVFPLIKFLEVTADEQDEMVLNTNSVSKLSSRVTIVKEASYMNILIDDDTGRAKLFALSYTSNLWKTACNSISSKLLASQWMGVRQHCTEFLLNSSDTTLWSTVETISLLLPFEKEYKKRLLLKVIQDKEVMLEELYQELFCRSRTLTSSYKRLGADKELADLFAEEILIRIDEKTFILNQGGVALLEKMLGLQYGNNYRLAFSDELKDKLIDAMRVNYDVDYALKQALGSYDHIDPIMQDVVALNGTLAQANLLLEHIVESNRRKTYHNRIGLSGKLQDKIIENDPTGDRCLYLFNMGLINSKAAKINEAIEKVAPLDTKKGKIIKDILIMAKKMTAFDKENNEAFIKKLGQIDTTGRYLYQVIDKGVECDEAVIDELLVEKNNGKSPWIVKLLMKRIA